MTSSSRSKSFRIAIAQVPITGDARKNGKVVRDYMRKAAQGKARLIQFPEGLLSGYAKNPIIDWSEVNWDIVRQELDSVMSLAAELNLWVVLGSAHPLTPPHWPHNSLYVISDEGKLVTRYDKRMISYTEVTTYYTAGYEPIVFEVDGYRFGCVICVEINFPQLFIEYGQLGIDCLLFSAYPVDSVFAIKARAYAAIHNYWVGLSTPVETASFISSACIGPDGENVVQLSANEGLIFADMDRNDPKYDIPLNKAKPWRFSVAGDPKYQTRQLNDPRSVDRTCL